jgi:hypothetical protein
MGGNTFDKTKSLNLDEYNKIIQHVKDLSIVEHIDFLMPYRLENKILYGDVDFILSDTDKFINLFDNKSLNEYKIIDIKTISLFEEKYGLYSKHILTSEYYQIDLLKSWNLESMEITRAYYSYSFANIFLKRLTKIIDRNLKFSYLGLICTSNNFVIPPNIKYIQIDNKTRLIIDCDYAFNLIDLDYSRYIKGFNDEVELFEYFIKSKYYSQIKFKSNSKFKHDYLRLKPFANLVNSGLIQVENFITI